MTTTALPPTDRSCTNDAVVQASSLTKLYGRGASAVTALDDVTISMERGHLTAIMGPSGSGKSTLMHCLAGLDSPTGGRVLLGDLDLTRLSDAQLSRVRRDRIGFVFQSFNLLPTLTAEQNITLPRILAGRRVDRGRLATLAESFGITDRLHHRPSELSGGQQQRVAIVRALLGSPDVVFADEPTGALDRQTSTEVLSFLRRSAHELGQSVVMVTHDPAAAAYADRVVLLADGAVAGELHAPAQDDVLGALSRLGA